LGNASGPFLSSRANVSPRRTVWRGADVVDLPDVTRERDDIRGVADELDGGRQVQLVHSHCDRAVAVHLHECAGVGQRRTGGWGLPENSLRGGAERSPAGLIRVEPQKWDARPLLYPALPALAEPPPALRRPTH